MPRDCYLYFNTIINYAKCNAVRANGAGLLGLADTVQLLHLCGAETDHRIFERHEVVAYLFPATHYHAYIDFSNLAYECPSQDIALGNKHYGDHLWNGWHRTCSLQMLRRHTVYWKSHWLFHYGGRRINRRLLAVILPLLL